MKQDIRIKVVEQPKPDLTKLARALLLLAEELPGSALGDDAEAEVRSA
jgi:hypothetical protein